MHSASSFGSLLGAHHHGAFLLLGEFNLLWNQHQVERKGKGERERERKRERERESFY
jgi:hypothetical protein